MLLGWKPLLTKNCEGSALGPHLQSNKLGSFDVRDVQSRYETSVSEIRDTSWFCSQCIVTFSYPLPKEQFPPQEVYKMELCLQLTMFCIAGDGPSTQNTLIYRISNILIHFCSKGNNTFVKLCFSSFGKIQFHGLGALQIIEIYLLWYVFMFQRSYLLYVFISICLGG